MSQDSADEYRPAIVDRIVSGGQTGVDRAGLDIAIGFGIEHGGWCPLGRRAEDGPIPACYQLAESDSADYAVRTERNVVDSDGTLILYLSTLSGGSELTYWLTRKHGRPCQLIDLHAPVPSESVRKWIQEHRIRVLNVAGPRASQGEEIYAMARAYLELILKCDG